MRAGWLLSGCQEFNDYTADAVVAGVLGAGQPLSRTLSRAVGGQQERFLVVKLSFRPTGFFR